ncbi:peptidoglycan DD-metalloendopeptidase family protein [Colwellia sp. MB3u-70]|uniref:murein hydrolase activator EnvC family protein n=1 Tax=unclassified Colwellia TaxID=196834 RepID=UPI0015F3AE64|nr:MULTISPECIES: peptidoglycan DD-metalloendopeptidase family protein [unclassified Colwellia]MBA6294041.1 peptidoglycan DD-metalloendopeptidase family protein [Colwellia sp. MB3u-8]MBA6307582.1 peptidoglycan DD-metalloendopeptidase family protein [Colwellia sp. MB3u-70]
MNISKPILERSQFSTGYAFFIGLVLIFCSFDIFAQTDANVKNSAKANQQLSDIQQAINQQKQTLSSTNVEISDLEQQLKTDDIAIGQVARNLANTSSSLTTTRQKLGQLSSEKKQLALAKKQQEQILAKQLRAAYSTGHHDYIKLILNQQKPSNVQRTITHYQYLNAARIKEIEAFKSTITQLNDVTAQYQQQAEQLTQLTQTQSQQKQLLELSKTKQKQTLKALNKKALTEQQKLAKLEREESALVALLKKMAVAARKVDNLVGLSKLKRKLSWPVKGKIRHRFGSSKQGYLKWKGVFLSAPIGQQVKAIHNGTILFSDWLKGYGLVSVVDHGDGYMSLYGHNQALLKAVGNRVEAGEPIALVGQSGGQANSGLYFEIRHTGIAVNPKLWCK